jgi:hypothetical protein
MDVFSMLHPARDLGAQLLVVITPRNKYEYFYTTLSLASLQNAYKIYVAARPWASKKFKNP